MIAMDLVYNPVAGSFRKERLDALVAALSGEGFAVRAVPTAAQGVVLDDSAAIVCVHGGDGTVRDVVQGLGARAGIVPLAVAASGTINLVARELGYSRKPAAFARQLREAWERGPDSWVHSPLYALGTLPVVSCFSIGPDSHAVSRVSGALKKRIGRYAYVAAMMRQMREWPRHEMGLSGELADGSPFGCRAEAVFVSHGAFYAGPYRLSEAAALKADSVELITLARSTRLGTLAFVAAALLRLPLARMGLAEIRTVRRLAFDRLVTPVQVDGDHIPDCGEELHPTGMVLRYVV